MNGDLRLDLETRLAFINLSIAALGGLKERSNPFLFKSERDVLLLVSLFPFFHELLPALFDLLDNVISFEGRRTPEYLAYPLREGSMAVSRVGDFQ
jgi:hypothetical protein